MDELVTMSEAQAGTEVRAALARAGLRVTDVQLARFIKTHRHMQARLGLLRRQLDASVPPVLVFPAASYAEPEPPDGL